MKVRTVQGDSIDSMCWNHYGKTTGMVELVLKANPGLADLGVILPTGTLVEMPTAPVASANNAIVKLWD